LYHRGTQLQAGDRAKIILALDTSGDRTAERQEAIAERLGLSRQTVNIAQRDFLADSVKDLIQKYPAFCLKRPAP